MVRSEIRQQTGQSVEASVRAFKNVQIQRDAELSRTASLLAEIPPPMAVMTTQHAPTIQSAAGLTSAIFSPVEISDFLVSRTRPPKSIAATSATAPMTNMTGGYPKRANRSEERRVGKESRRRWVR